MALRERATEVDAAERERAIDVLENGDPCYVLDRDFRVLLVNRGQEAITGVAREESLGRCLWDVWPEAANPALKIWPTYQRVMRERRAEMFEEYFAPLDLWVEVHVFPTSEGGIAIAYRRINDRKRAEEALRRSEARLRASEAALRCSEANLRAIVENSPVGLCVRRGEALVHERVNPAFQAIAPGKEFVGRPLAEAWPESAAYYLPLIREVLETGEARRVENVPIQIRRTPGGPVEEACFTSSWAPLPPDESGEPGVLEIVFETTEQVRTQQRIDELRRTAESNLAQLEAVFESISEGVILADRDGNVLAMNPEARRVHGNADLPLEHTPLARVLRGESFREQVVRVLDPGSGTERTCSFSGRPVRDEEGRTLLAVLTVRDVSAERSTAEILRASEARFRSVFEHAAVGMATVRFEDARWTDVNDVFCRMLGRTREEMLRSAWPVMTHPDDLELDAVPFERMSRGELEGYTVEKRFLHATGAWVWARLTLSLVRDHEGRPGYEIAVIEDIGDRKRAEASVAESIEQQHQAALALHDANEQLREVDRRKDEFLAMLSHELRNPLTPIQNSVMVLEKAPPGGDQANRSLTVIRRQVTHMSRLIDDLLDVTRISQGKIRLQRDALTVNEVVRAVAEDLGELFRTHAIGFQVSITERPLRVLADRTRVAQVVGNLLQNAAKFTPAGQRVTLSLEPCGDHAVIRVRDTGVGIERPVLENLFEPFVQADRTLDRTKGGLGLGLALVKGLVELHGGRVSGASRGAGTGAEFVVRLPLAGVEPAAVDAGEEDREGRQMGKRILVIEDNVDAAASLKELLELGEHVVQTAGTGLEGIEKARAFRPEVVLCDIGLPGIDGFEVARRMRADPTLGPARLVALSGYAAPEDLEKSRAAGFDQHLAKPPDVAALEATIELGAAQAG
jgi:PAS domain S-box-containing protein